MISTSKAKSKNYSIEAYHELKKVKYLSLGLCDESTLSPLARLCC